MTFGDALEECKQGARIWRKGWNGKNQYVELAHKISYVNSRGEIVNADHRNIGHDALAFVGTSGVQIGWLASQADMLADDWVADKEVKADGWLADYSNFLREWKWKTQRVRIIND